MKQILCLLGALFCFVDATLSAQEKTENAAYEKKTFTTSTGEKYGYRVLFPENFDSQKQYPLVLFLHGAGERGDNNESQLTHGGGLFLNPLHREKYPAIVLFPQCPSESYWGYGKRPMEPGTQMRNELFPKAEPEISPVQFLDELIDSYVASGNVDTRRIYVMGLSMGGMGTLDLLARYPHRFAAAVAICGGIDSNRLSPELKGTAIWLLHGDADDVVPVENSRQVYRRLKKEGVPVRYKEYPGCNHGSWNPAFNEPDFLAWVFAQKRKRK